MYDGDYSESDYNSTNDTARNNYYSYSSGNSFEPGSSSGSNFSGGSRGGYGSGGGRKNNGRKGGVILALALGIAFGLCAFGIIFGVGKATGLFAKNNPASESQAESASSGVTITNHGNASEKETGAVTDTADAGKDLSVVQTSSTYVSTTAANDVADIVEQVMPSVVAVNTKVETIYHDWYGREYTEESAGAGSGIIISEEDGLVYVMTNYHVVQGAKEVSIQFSDDTSATAAVLGYDKDQDIAVVTIDKSELSAETLSAIKIAVLGDSSTLRAGESAIAIGNALGYGQSVTTGVISALNRKVQLEDKTMTLIQTSAAINPGNSGGALLNGKGEVIGINTVKYEDTSVEGMGYAIPINDAVTTAKGIVDGTIVEKSDKDTPFLGIMGGTLTEETAAQYDMPAGVYISNVVRGSAADMAGLEQGCVITAFNGQQVTTMEELQDAIAECVPGDQVTITAHFYSRDGYVEKELTAILGAKSDIGN